LNCNYDQVKNTLVVYVDDSILEANNYELSSGSTIVTLNKEYVQKLQEGNHTIRFATGVADLGEKTGTFIVSTVPYYSIKINDGTAKEGDNVVDATEAGSTVIITANEKEGKIFEKWTVRNNEITLDHPTESPTEFTMPSKDLEITANYKDIVKEYNINVDGCIATTDGKTVTKAAAGKKITVTATVPENKTFHSWTTSQGLTLPKTNPAGFDMPANSVSITANLGGTVTFSNNGKTGAKNMPANQLVKAGDKVTKPKEDEKPTLEGYRFLGWYTTSEGTTEFDFDKTTISQNTTIYAHWIKTHTVKFETKHGIAPEKQVIDDGKKATKPTDPQMTGYKFVGWYTDSTLRSAYNWDTPVKEDKILYAKWTGELKITDGNGGTAHYGSDYSFTLNCDFDEVYIPFELKIDSKVINYEQYELKAVKGGTEVVLKKALVRSLAAGNHTIDFITGVEDLGSVHGTFKVSTSPKTGDESNVVLWGAVAAVSLIAVAAIIYFLNKKKKKK
jgi:uncharacterized repeat protein (TIGR02543 family)/LPXTG-motif cell wall-anchored protein